MARQIDLDQLMKYPLRRGSEHCDEKNADPRFLNGVESILEWAQTLPTLTTPNEWVSVEERLPEPGDLIVYADNTVWGYQYGICRVCGKEKAFDYWIPLQDPPNNRPQEGEEHSGNLPGHRDSTARACESSRRSLCEDRQEDCGSY